MYAVTSKPLVSFTRATLRNAEFGFLGVTVHTRVQTPRRCGQDLSAGASLVRRDFFLGFRISWLIVGIGLIANENNTTCQALWQDPELFLFLIQPVLFDVDRNAGRSQITYGHGAPDAVANVA